MKFFTRLGAMPAQEAIGAFSASDETPRLAVSRNARR